MKNIKKQPNKGEIVIYKAKHGKASLKVKLKEGSVWLTQAQIAHLFGTKRPAITKHLSNIFKSKELDEKLVSSILEHTATDGKKYKTKFYNLDVIISIGCRVNSRRATQFRIWATEILKDHLIKGFTLNQKRIKEKGLDEFEKALALIKNTIDRKKLSDKETAGLLKIITDYANSWVLLQRYDEDKLEIKKTTKIKYSLDYDESQQAITELKDRLMKKKEASNFFGFDKKEVLKGILGNINQTFSGKELYPSIEEKAAHLLYFVIKDHPFTDGNKRIGSFLFILFLARNKHLFNKKGERRFNDNALVALTLLIAESHPKQKDTMVKLTMNFLHN